MASSYYFLVIKKPLFLLVWPFGTTTALLDTSTRYHMLFTVFRFTRQVGADVPGTLFDRDWSTGRLRFASSDSMNDLEFSRRIWSSHTGKGVFPFTPPPRWYMWVYHAQDQALRTVVVSSSPRRWLRTTPTRALALLAARSDRPGGSSRGSNHQKQDTAGEGW